MAVSSIEVAHEIDGRVRFELPPSLLERRRRAGISAALDAHPNVSAHRFNIRGRSLIVEHRPALKARTIAKIVSEAVPADPVDRGHPGSPDRHVRSLVALGAGGALALAGQPPFP